MLLRFSGTAGGLTCRTRLMHATALSHSATVAKEEITMIEVNLTYDLLQGIDSKAYSEWALKTVGAVLKAPGLIEFRANRNILGSPQVRSTSLWRSLADWANYTDTDEWRQLETEFRAFISNLRVEIWGPSPVMPEPVRPPK